MKYLFINSKIKDKIKIPDDLISKLPNKIVIATTVQFASQLESWKKQLENRKIKVFYGKGKHAKFESQILGCDVLAVTSVISKADAVLYVGDGFFHPKAILLKTKKDIFWYNPITKEHKKITQEDIKKDIDRKRASISKYYISKNIGILVSTKFGQQHLKEAMKFKELIKKDNKRGFIFLTNTLDFLELENFPFIDCWVNTMCPRIADEDYEKIRKPIINLSDISDFKY